MKGSVEHFSEHHFKIGECATNEYIADTVFVRSISVNDGIASQIVDYVDIKEERKMNKEFKSLKDIKSGYVVELRNGAFCICMRCRQDKFEKCLLESDKRYWYLYDGLNHYNSTNKDIVKIYGLSDFVECCLKISPDNRPLLWERKEPKKLTVNEVSKLLGFEVEIIGGNSNE